MSVVDKEKFLAGAQDLYFRFLDQGLANLIYLDDNTAFAPGGQNGPHFALETPVRNTCHWLAAFAIGYRIRPSSRYLQAGTALYRWLVNDCVFHKSGYYVVRQAGRDWCNGVIGNAWLIEALVRAGSYLQIEQARQTAEALYITNRFDAAVGAWHRYDPLNKKYSIDFTLDHQSWFACAASDLGKHSEVEQFLSACQRGAFRVRQSGRIAHLYYAWNIRGILFRMFFFYREHRIADFIAELEEGYQHYTLLPFARLFQRHSAHPFFKSEEFERAVRYVGPAWLKAVATSRYGYQYNAPGFELPVIIGAFEAKAGLTWADMQIVLEQQMNLVGNKNQNLCAKNNPDPLTLSARIYELGLFLEYVTNGTSGDIEDE